MGVNHKIFIHPDDQNIRTLFDEIMMGMADRRDEDESDSDEDEVTPGATKVEEVVAEPIEEVTKAECCNSGSDDDADAIVDGIFFKVVARDGAAIYGEPRKDESVQRGSMGRSTLLHAYVDGRPDGWIQLIGMNCAWLSLDPVQEEDLDLEAREDGKPPVSRMVKPLERLGGLFDVTLGTIVQTPISYPTIRRWMKEAKAPITAEDLLAVREIQNVSLRLILQEKIRVQIGDEHTEKLLDDVERLVEGRKKRLKTILGYSRNPYGVLHWVTPTGIVRGLHPNGLVSRFRLSITEGKIELGPFRLNETGSCNCIEWIKSDSPTTKMSWERDDSLAARLRYFAAMQ